MGRDQAARLRERVRPGADQIWAVAAFGATAGSSAFADHLRTVLAPASWMVAFWGGGPVKRGRILLIDAGGDGGLKRPFLSGTGTWVLLVAAERAGVSGALNLLWDMRKKGRRDVWFVLSDVPSVTAGEEAVERLGRTVADWGPYQGRALAFYEQGAPEKLTLAGEARRQFLGGDAS